MAVSAVLALSLASPGRAADVYVATIGDDGNAGSLGAPYRTIQFAVDNVGPGNAQILQRCRPDHGLGCPLPRCSPQALHRLARYVLNPLCETGTEI